MFDRPDVVVIGAGAGGIFAAWRAAELGAKVVLLEKTGRIGTKILVSGGGKCNVAHDGPLEDVLKAFRPNEARFIRPACYKLTNRRIIELFQERGLRVYTRPDGRVFPIDQTAKDVVEILRNCLREAGVDVRLNHPVEGLVTSDGQVTGVKVGEEYRAHAGFRKTSESRYGAKALLAEVIGETSSGGGSRSSHVISCGHVVLASGGSSYPNSGTTGDGWAWVKELGHRVVKIRAALAPIYLESPNTEFSGIALRGCTLKARQNGKEVARWTGDVLFTHQGVSGPDALGISRLVAEKLEDGEVSLEVDIVPDRSQEQLSEDLLRWAGGNPRRQLVGFVQDLAPDRLAGSLLASASIVPDLTAARLDKKSRNRLSTILKGWPIGRVRHVPLELGEVAAGGVSLDEVDAQTMESRRCHGLYLCGEVLDVAGPVGGYNLQAAFATGWLAGESAATSL